MNKEEHDELSRLIKEGYLAEDGEPLKCTKCEGTNFYNSNVCIDGGHLSEYKVKCSSCEACLGYWCTGSWQIW